MLGRLGRQPRRHGVAWRETSPDTPPSEVGGRKRYVEWKRGLSALAHLLPPSQREALDWLAIDPEVLFETPGGPVIHDPARVAGIQAECLRRLRRGHIDARAADAAGKRLKRALAAIDPGRLPMLHVPVREQTRPLALGDAVHGNATKMVASGRPIGAYGSAAGYPLLGHVATVAHDGPRVVPPACLNVEEFTINVGRPLDDSSDAGPGAK